MGLLTETGFQDPKKWSKNRHFLDPFFDVFSLKPAEIGSKNGPKMTENESKNTPFSGL